MEERIARYPHLAENYAQAKYPIWISLPLVVEGKSLGGITITFQGLPDFTLEDRALMLSVLQQCAQAIARSQLYEAEQRARSQAEAANRMKDAFRQADSSTTRMFGGLGLGLAISRHIIELHRGIIGVDSPGEGKGATFTIRLPLLTTLARVEEEGLINNTLDLQGIQVLVVDDDVDNLELTTFMLEQSGASVIRVSSAQAALQSLRQMKPDILLADIGMPEMDGYMLLRQVRLLEAEQGDSPVPAIALTAYAGEANRQQVLGAGLQHYLPKPVEPEALLKAVLSLVL